MFKAFLEIHPGFYGVALSSHLNTPYTPVVRLIEIVYERFPLQALKILRKPFILNYEPSPICKETLKVCGKRFQIDPHFSPSYFEDFSNSQTFQLSPSPWLNQSLKLEQAKIMLQNELQKLVSQLGPRYTKNRSVLALALSKDLRVLELQQNQNAIFKSHHAEVQLVRSYWNRTQSIFPAESWIITSLQSCRMCAAHLYTFAPHSQILYLQKDSGPHSRQTLISHKERLF